MLTVKHAARLYAMPLIDYGDDQDAYEDRRGVLLGSGCGLMMGVMDAVPFRWCMDTDELKLHQNPYRVYQLTQFVEMVSRAPDGGIALAGWFSISDPTPFRTAFAELDPPGIVYAGNVRLGVPGEVSSLEEFIVAARDAVNPCRPRALRVVL